MGFWGENPKQLSRTLDWFMQRRLLSQRALLSMVTVAGPFCDFGLGKLSLEPLCHDMHYTVVDKLFYSAYPVLVQVSHAMQGSAKPSRHNYNILLCIA